VGSWLVVDCEDKKLQQSDLRVSFSLDVVVVARNFAINTMCTITIVFLIY
jgi:hypothetical protein